MKAIMISIKPKLCAEIMNGNKTIEIRKSKALATAIQKLIDENGYADIYVYCTKDNKNYLYKDYDEEITHEKVFVSDEKPLIKTSQLLNSKVLFKFRCYKVETIKLNLAIRFFTESMFETAITTKSCLSSAELFNYLHTDSGYAIHISDLEIFDKPKELSEFKSYKKNIVNTKINGMVFETELDNSLIKAPQNFCYVEVEIV